MSDSEGQERLTSIPGACPTPLELGVSGWNILHSSAAVYPYKPSAVQKEAMKNLIESWAHVYACSWCAYHMREYVRHHPPNVHDKLTVSRYICEMHNDVNERLGKDTFDCSPDVVLSRWHPGYPNKMEDHPTIEEQLAAADREKSARKEAERPQQQEGSGHHVNVLGRYPREAAPKDAASWRDVHAVTSREDGGLWSRWFSRKSSSTFTEATDNSPSGPNSSTTVDIPGIGAPLQRHGWVNSASEVHRNSVAPTPSRAKAADSETDVDAVLERLKRCQVYCPENEQLNH